MSDDRAARLRAQFDRSFAAAPPSPAAPMHDFLRIRIAGEPYAIALDEVAALHVDLAPVPVPSPSRALLGVAAVRGALVPIYDLRIALGADGALAPRWVAVVRGRAVGFAFDGFDGFARAATRAPTIVTLDGRQHPIAVLGELMPRQEG